MKREEEGEFSFCLHPWIVTVEMTNVPRPGSTSDAVLARTESTCDGALTTRYAFQLAELSLEAHPHCRGLSLERQRNTVTTLATCLALRGDRVAAASVFDAKGDGRPRRGLDSLDPRVWRAWLGTNGSPRLDWDGQSVVTERGRNNSVAEFVVDRLKERPGLQFRPVTHTGVDARTVEVAGLAEYELGEGEQAIRYHSPYSQTWVWDPNLQDWMVSVWTVGAFAPMN